MLTVIENHEILGPYSDLQNHNLVLQVMEFDEENDQNDMNDYLNSSLDKLIGKKGSHKKIKSENRSKKIEELLEKKGKAFVHTPEYYAAIKDQKNRMKAYRELIITSSVPYGEDAEIAENPFKFLNLPEDATFGQTRASWIHLRKLYFPDFMNPENPEQYKRIFGNSKFIIENKDFDSWLKEINRSSRPELLSLEVLGEMSSQDQEKYKIEHEVYRQKELEYEKVKQEMILRATKKSTIINKSYAEAKKRFSDSEIESFAGFIWEKGTSTSELLSNFFNFREIEYEYLDLECPGQIRKDSYKQATNRSAFLSFDYGELYLGDNDFRQSVNLKSFFSWTELILDKELCPTLLEDMVDDYKLNENQSEQLRLMIINKEKTDFILDALNIPQDENNELNLLYFVERIYNGPKFSHAIYPRGSVSFKLGVELTPDGGMNLKYKTQVGGDLYSFEEDAKDSFTPVDMQMMQAIAYGPLLQEPKTE